MVQHYTEITQIMQAECLVAFNNFASYLKMINEAEELRKL